jgi:hypothetical protein
VSASALTQRMLMVSEIRVSALMSAQSRGRLLPVAQYSAYSSGGNNK